MSDQFVATAIAAATEAGAYLRERFGQPHDVRHKGTVDLVTEADRGAEALIVARLRAAFPDHRLLGEEGTADVRPVDTDPASPYGWIVDPLDGTTNFAHGVPHFAVSIGLEERGEPLVGVVYDPLRDELFVAARGKGASCNGAPLAVSSTGELIEAILATGFSYSLSRREQQAVAWQRFLTRVQAIRQTGSAALNLCYVAAGRFDGYWEWGLQPWDFAAGALIVTEAGGTLTDYTNGPFHLYDDELVASNPLLHPALIAVLRECGKGSADDAREKGGVATCA
ncbi:MAG: inositol monophosphatase [Chloroflexota bacterium]|nr:inositol monophosphatase [Chloroflexota bacterium]